MKLVPPDVKYQASYLAAINETLAEDAKNMEMLQKHTSVAEIKADFAAYVEKLRSFAAGENLPQGYVPDTILWLVDDAEKEFLGQVSIRHHLTEFLKNIGGHIGYFIRPSARGKGHGTQALALAIQQAQSLGIEEILLTCDTTNLASKRIIEKNGGKFENRYPVGNGHPDKLRFWISPH